MSGIQIVIPIEMLGGSTELTPNGIINVLEEVEVQRRDAERWRNAFEDLKSQTEGFAHAIGADLERIVTEVPDEYAKARAIRELINNLKGYHV